MNFDEHPSDYVSTILDASGAQSPKTSDPQCQPQAQLTAGEMERRYFARLASLCSGPTSWSFYQNGRLSDVNVPIEIGNECMFPVGCTNLYLHSLHCALKVAHACVLREKSSGLCKCMQYAK